MIGFTTAIANAILDDQLDGSWLGWFTTAPNGAGTGGTEADYTSYARVQPTWAAAASRAKANSATVQNPLKTGGADDILVAWGLWDAQTNGNLIAWGWAFGAAPKGFTAQASNTIASPAHGWGNDQPLILAAVPGESLPSGVTEGTVYYVISTATDTFQISATVGGAAVDIGDGRGIVGTSGVKTIHDDERPQVLAGSLSVEM